VSNKGVQIIDVAKEINIELINIEWIV